ncbi:MAG: GHKL domain-containing protein, partial [Spirochaetales bacterium]|nr:GHKL domain-containing protein [Spirochaetales bacterium]
KQNSNLLILFFTDAIGLIFILLISKQITAQHYLFSRTLTGGIILLDIFAVIFTFVIKDVTSVNIKTKLRHICIYANRLLLSFLYMFLFYRYFPVRIGGSSPIFLIVLGSQLHLLVSLILLQKFKYIIGTSILFFAFFMQIILLTIIRGYLLPVPGLVLLFSLIIYLVNMLAAGHHESSLKEKAAADKIHDLKTQLIQYERTRQVEAMTASFIHEVNNPLTPMEGNVFFIHEQQEILASLTESGKITDPDIRDTICNISDELASICRQYEIGFKRIQKLIDRIKHVYLVTKSGNPIRVDGRSILNDVIMLTVPQHLRSIVSIEAPDKFEIYIQEIDLVSLFSNPLKNAIEAVSDMKDKKEIIIEIQIE